jgi:hypothetical protein
VPREAPRQEKVPRPIVLKNFFREEPLIRVVPKRVDDVFHRPENPWSEFERINTDAFGGSRTRNGLHPRKIRNGFSGSV